MLLTNVHAVILCHYTIAPWDAKKKRLEREKAVTNLVLKKNDTKSKEKNKRMKEMSFSQVEKEFRIKVKLRSYNFEILVT